MSEKTECELVNKLRDLEVLADQALIACDDKRFDSARGWIFDVWFHLTELIAVMEDSEDSE